MTQEKALKSIVEILLDGARMRLKDVVRAHNNSLGVVVSAVTIVEDVLTIQDMRDAVEEKWYWFEVQNDFGNVVSYSNFIRITKNTKPTNWDEFKIKLVNSL